MKGLGQELRRVRVAAQLTQEQVAARAKLTREYISHVERGVYMPTVDVFARICRAIGTAAWQVLKKASER